MRLRFLAIALTTSCGGPQYSSETPKVDVAIPEAAPIDAGTDADTKHVDVDAGAPPLPPIPQIGEAAVPFAHYAVAMHKRIHPIFTDQFLTSLDQLPLTHPLNDARLATTLEIVLNRDGSLFKMGVLRSSGITAFDIAALDSVQRAQPFGQAPPAILSYDDHVYMRWEFHRDSVIGCSTNNTWPIMLRAAPQNP